MTERQFFAYHPLVWRLLLLFCACLSLALTGWAIWGWAHGGGLAEAARTALSLGLFAGIVNVAFRLRPRTGWGVAVGPTVLTVARPKEGHIDIPWSAVREIRRLGRSRDKLVLFLSDERRVLVARQLFAKRRDFEALVAAIEEKMPPLPYDA